MSFFAKFISDRLHFYKKLSLDDNEAPPKPKFSSAKYIIFFAVTICGIILFTILGLFMYLHPTLDLSDQTHPCGNSTEEARNLGCSFDQLMWAWYPKRCPHYGNEQYISADPDRPWKFYTDPYKKETLDDKDWDKVLNNDLTVYTEKGEHLTHCIFMLLGAGQIIRGGGKYTPKQIDYEHLEHCAWLLFDELKQDPHFYDIRTKAPKVAFDQDC